MAEQDLQSKINRAVIAVLIEDGAGSQVDTFAEFDSTERALPNTTVNAGQAGELVLFTGLWKFGNVTVTMRDKAANDAGAANLNAQWLAALSRYNLVRTALSKVGTNGEFNYMPNRITTLGRALAVTDSTASGDQRALDNADMENFTVTWWNLVGLSSPRQSPDGNYFESELQFECHACNGNIS